MFINKLGNPFVGIICGTLTSLAKLAMNLALGVLLQLPMGFLALGLGGAALTHTVFGATGGLIAAQLIKRLKPRLANWD